MASMPVSMLLAARTARCPCPHLLAARPLTLGEHIREPGHCPYAEVSAPSRRERSTDE